MPKINRECPVCGASFAVFPSQRKIACSREHGVIYRLMSGSYAGGERSLWEVRKMSDAECAWFAAALDGEGCIVAQNRNKYPSSSFRIQLTNTCIPFLERAIEYTGVGYIRHTYKPDSSTGHKDGYNWYCCVTSQATEILRQVRPWLIVKAERADAVLQGKTFPRQSRWDGIYPEE
jgi:hypothetical protein